ncbi:MAG TPA: hypothetical protein VMW72_26600 [Sedimentisphaerales bacterium]|nr:hypothetical protein [Sedimentisphaerales bacterium]
MKKVILVISLASAIVLVSTCAKREEGRCRLRYHQVDISESRIYYACQDQFRLSEKPAQLKDLPKKISNRVNYFHAKIAGREIPLIIDRGRKSKLYLDTDADGCLSDEKGFTSKTVKRRLFGPVDYYRFGPISVKFEQAAEKFAQQIYVFTRDSYMRHLILCPAHYRKGKVLLDQNIYEVRVVDGNFDGKYGRILSLPIEKIWRPGCDSFAIDLNHNGKLDFNYYLHSEIMPLGRMVRVGNSYYSINIAEGGTFLELNKIQPECGTLDLGNTNVKLKLWSDAAQQYISDLKSNGPIPAGRYKALFIELSQIDSERNAWTFTSYRDTGALYDFEINKNETTSFEIGPPFQIKVTPRQGRDTVYIRFKLEGQASEQYRSDVKRNGIRVSPPLFKIIDEGGIVVDSGWFEYG